MNGTIGHLRNVADLVAALNTEAILAEAGLEDHELAPDLRAAVVMGYAALTKIAALVEEATAAPVIDRDRVRALLVEAAKTERSDLLHACADYLVEEATEAGLALIREALVEKVAQ